MVLFIIAGLLEIGGGWLIWKWLREGRPAWWGALGAVLLAFYGVPPTFQASNFGCTYAVECYVSPFGKSVRNPTSAG